MTCNPQGPRTNNEWYFSTRCFACPLPAQTTVFCFFFSDFRWKNIDYQSNIFLWRICFTMHWGQFYGLMWVKERMPHETSLQIGEICPVSHMVDYIKKLIYFPHMISAGKHYQYSLWLIWEWRKFMWFGFLTFLSCRLLVLRLWSWNPNDPFLEKAFS